MLIYTLATLGLLVSIYALYVSKSKKKMLCDLSKNISCSKALRSKDGKIFRVHNSVLGIVYYVSLFPLKLLELNLALTFIASLALVFSLFLAYKLIKKRNFCLVCIFSYLLNLALFLAFI
ncbi:MAG: vitamin K epoxide reductase family protein [Candidatus Woesearchaeota archaeon]